MAEGDTTTPITRRQSTGSHIFAEFESLEGLNAPIRASARIKYTSIGVSRRYIALGASTGGLYIFHRESLKYLQVLSNKEGAITKVAFAPDDNIVGFATSFGFVIAWELNIDKRDQPERLAISSAHRNVQVTSLQWDAASLRLFSGDNKGRVTQTNGDSRKASGFFKMPTELVLSTDSPIIQIDFADEKVLVSAQTKCIVCDTIKKQSYTVGKKPRDGQYGGCFLQRPGSDIPAIYTGRPGSRIWEANAVDGQVQATHQFKHLLALPSLPVVGPSKQPEFPTDQKPQSFNFPVLLPMGSRFLLTWNERGVFIFDPFAVDVVVWTSDITGIVDAGCHKGQLYCMLENGQLHRYFLLSIERCIAKLFGQSLWQQCAKMCTVFAPRVTHLRARRHIPLSLIKELNYQLMENTKDLHLIEEIEDLLDRIKSASPGSCSTASSRRSSLESCDSVRLESGIYLIRNRHDSEDSLDDVSLQAGDDATSMITLRVPDGPLYGADTISVRSDEDPYSGEVFTSANQDVTSGHSESLSEPDGGLPNGTEHTEIPQQESTQHSFDTVSDGSSKDRTDSQISVGSASEINANAMQVLSVSSNNSPVTMVTPQQLSTISVNQDYSSTKYENQCEDVQSSDEKPTLPDSNSNQSVAPSNSSLTQGGDPLVRSGELIGQGSVPYSESDKVEDYDNQLDLVMEQVDSGEVASFVGQRTTPEVMSSPLLKNLDESDSLEQSGQEIQSFDSSIDSDIIKQDFESSTSESLRQGLESSTESNSVPFSTNISSSSVPSHFDQDASPTRPPVPHPLRRAMSVPTRMAEAEVNPAVIRRRGSDTGKKKKRKKRKSKIVEIGDLPSKPIPSTPEEREETIQDEEDSSASQPSSEPTRQTHPSPIRSASTPTSHISSTSPSLSSVASASPRMLHVSESSTPGKQPSTPPQRIAPPRPNPNTVPRSQTRHNSWDDSSGMWQGASSGMMPPTAALFVDLSLAPKLDLLSVSDSISAMKESLSSTLTNAKSFLLNKMDSKEELHHSVSSPTFNLYFPEDDRKRAERLQSLVQDGKVQKVHPAARALVAATSAARSRLEDPSILYNASETRKILKEWVQYLHAAVHQLYTEQPQVPPSEEDTKTTPDVTASSEQPDTDQIHQSNPEGIQETDSQEFSVKAKSVCSEEPSATESVMSESQKDIDDKIEDSTATTLTSVDTLLPENKPMGDSSSADGQVPKKPSPLPPSSSNKSFLGFLEKLGTGAHSMEVFDEDRKVKDQVKSKDDNENATDDDDLKMESIPDLVSAEDSVSVASDAVVTKSNTSLGDEPTRTNSDAEPSSFEHVEVQIERQIFCVKDPFSLPSEIHQEIGEMVVMCFEMGIYGDLKKDCTQNVLSGGDDDVDDTSRTKPVFEIGQSDGNGQCKDRSSQLGSLFYVPKHLQPSNQSEQPESDIQDEEASLVAMETDEDKVAGEFIKEYFHFLDVTKLRNVLSVREEQRKHCMEALISCLQAKYKDHSQLRQIEEAAADVGIDHLKTVAQKTPGIELCFASRIYEKSYEGGVKYMILTHNKVKPWEVLHIITARNDSTSAADFLSYVSGILEITPTNKRDLVFQGLCKEPSMRLQLFKYALSHKAPSKRDLFCTCGEMPRPGAHCKEWGSDDLIHRMLQLKCGVDVKQHMLQISQKHGHWHSVLRLLQQLNERVKALKLALQLADLSVPLESDDNESVIKAKNLEEWKMVLANVSRLIPHPSSAKRMDIEQLHCVDCNSVIWPKLNHPPNKYKSNKTSDWPAPEEPECDWSADGSVHNPDWLTDALTVSEESPDWLPTVTWESIAVLLVRSVGAQVGVELLREAKVPEGAISRQFHQACIASAILEKGQSNLSHAMLERVDTYLWSKRPTTLAPSLYQLVKNETKQAVERTSGEPATIEEQMELLGSFSLPEGESHYLEESDCHWGMHLDAKSICSVCGAGLEHSLPMAVQGIAVFTCGHVFHKLCIPEKTCVVCLESKVSMSPTKDKKLSNMMNSISSPLL